MTSSRWSPILTPSLLALALALSLPALAADDAAERAKAYQEGVAAYRGKDYPAFLAAAKRLLAFDPSNPKYLYNVACAESLTGDLKGAARDVASIVDRGIDLGFDQEEDLAAVRASKEYEPIRRKLEDLGKPIGRSEAAFTLSEKDQIPEGIAFDPAGRAWYVSSVHKRKIVRRAADGTLSDFVAEGQDGLWSVLAIGIDAPRKVLYACSAAFPEMAGYDESMKGSTGIFKYDLGTRKLLKKYLVPRETNRHGLGDLVLNAAGDVYASDGTGGAIYRILHDRDEIEEFLPAGTFRSPQGLAFDAKGLRLYIADYPGGITAVDVGTRERHEVAALPSAPLLGIDGLVWSPGGLVATQNGIRPHRVSRFVLDPSGLKVSKAEILEMNNPRFSEPTLGTIVDGTYYYVANSQWGMFDRDGKLAPMEKLAAPLVLKTPLAPR